MVDFFLEDRESALITVRRNWRALQYASEDIRRDKEVVLTAIAQDGWALEYASEELKNDREFIMTVVSRANGSALKYASNKLQCDKEIVLTAVTKDGWNIKFASEELQADKEIALIALAENGWALQYVSKNLRSDKDCILAAVQNAPSCLKFALDGLNQDQECLVAAGLWDENYAHVTVQKEDRRLIVLSTKFSLDQQSTDTATVFTIHLKENDFFCPKEGRYIIYSPNAFSKSTCDPDWTNLQWPCRGTFETCRMEQSHKMGEPTNESCWCYSFRCKLEEAKQSGGFMIQVVECGSSSGGDNAHCLGQGQKIELDMATAVGVKIFQIYQPIFVYNNQREGEKFGAPHIDELVLRLKAWYENDCRIMNVFKIGFWSGLPAPNLYPVGVDTMVHMNHEAGD